MKLDNYEIKVIDKHSEKKEEILLIIEIDHYEFCWRLLQGGKQITSDIFHSSLNQETLCPVCLQTFFDTKKCKKNKYIQMLFGSTVIMEQHFCTETPSTINYNNLFFN